MILRLSLISMHLQKINYHPLKLVRDIIGLTYEKATPVPMGDCWIFEGVQGDIPDEYKSLFTEITDP